MPEELPVDIAVDHRYTTVDRLRIHYAEAGTGPPVLLLHGWPQHWWEWRHVIPALAPRYRVICPDIRGLGWSEGADTRYSLDRLATDIVGLLDALDIDRAALVGHDWGLLAGYRACWHWPHRFTKFVALAGIHPWILDGATWRTLLAPWHVFLNAAGGESAAVQRHMTNRALSVWRYSGRFTDHERSVYLRSMDSPAARYATSSFYRNLVCREVPFLARQHRLIRQRVPTLHLNGARDPITVQIPTTFGDYADEMDFDILPDCGHFIAEEQPRLLSQRLIEFLGGH